MMENREISIIELKIARNKKQLSDAEKNNSSKKLIDTYNNNIKHYEDILNKLKGE